MRYKQFIIIGIVFNSIISYSAKAQKVLFLAKDDILKYQVTTISILGVIPFVGYTSYTSLDDDWTDFVFYRGRLIKEKHRNKRFSDSTENAFIYEKNRLIGYHINQGDGQEQHFLKYKYNKGKMMSSVQINSLYEGYNSETYTVQQDYENYKRYFYNALDS